MHGHKKYIVEKQVCGTCLRYHQHYVLGVRGEFFPLWYGHCHTPRSKHPQPDQRCDRWQPREEGEGS